VTFSHDSRLIATAGLAIVVKLLDAERGTLVKTLSLPDNALSSSNTNFIKAAFMKSPSGPGYILSVAFSPDDRMVAAGDVYNPLHLWDVQSGKLIRTIEDRMQTVNSVVFSRDGKVLIAGDASNSIKFWSVNSGTLLQAKEETDSIHSVALDPSGVFLASAFGDGHINVRRASDGSLIQSFKGHSSSVGSVAFSRDGKTLASSSFDMTTKVWSAGDGKLLLTLIYFKDGDWLVYTPEGYYEGSTGSAKYVTWRSGDRLYEASKYQQQFHRPELVAAQFRKAMARPLADVATPPVQPPLETKRVSVDPSAERKLWLQLPSKKFYALIIGNNNYRHMRTLTTAIKDAEDVEKILKSSYGFETKLLKDASRAQILGELNRLKRELDANSNLLIYYAGHGYKDEKVKKAYWWPVNAESGDETEWISADTITTSLKGMDARHVLIISDSCYSGAMSRGEVVGVYKLTERERYLLKMMSGTSRILMASGGDEPVEDNSGNGHSVFANAFLRGLKEFEHDIFTAEELFHDFIRIPVGGKSGQTPEFDPLYNSGHDRGIFIFVRRSLQQ
jgi:WD40 repeat protein